MVAPSAAFMTQDCPAPWTATDTFEYIVILCPKRGRTAHSEPTVSPSPGGRQLDGPAT